MAKGVSLGEKVIRGTAAGGAAGGIYGAGTAEGGLENRDEGFVAGVPAGALVGTGLPLAVSGIARAAKPVVDAVRARINPAGYRAVPPPPPATPPSPTPPILTPPTGSQGAPTGTVLPAGPQIRADVTTGRQAQVPRAEAPVAAPEPSVRAEKFEEGLAPVDAPQAPRERYVTLNGIRYVTRADGSDVFGEMARRLR